VPADYGMRRARQDGASVQVLIDGGDATRAQVASSYAGQFLRLQDLDGRASPPTIQMAPRVVYNQRLSSPVYMIPGVAATLLLNVTTIVTAMGLAREREAGTLEQLLVTPIDPLGLILGKLAPYLILGCAEMALILLLMRFGFSVHIRGSLPFLFAMAVIYQFALLAIGLFISTRARTQTQAQQIAQMVFLPSVFLSGYIFPVEGLPWVLKAAGRLLPATHMIAILRGVVLRGAGPTALMPNVLALLGLAVVLVWMSARTFRKLAT
jgi:ABC-2 type transport system permease protein